ncbi:MAG: penicillin-binding transpeptidase domain-containing protein [Gammaproteobacteria bacterium]|nr:penicillin-binding transpeptidase domain-containing protein [Gammaproteobacteria bacterium]
MPDKLAYSWRYYFLSAILVLAALGVISRIAYLGVVKRNFLLNESRSRSVREVDIPAHRGMIKDRNGEPLAISIPMAAIWANPQLVSATSEQLIMLSQMLNLPISTVENKVSSHSKRDFVYLKRGVPPEIAVNIVALHIPGIYSNREYRRYYPEAEATAQVVGFTNIDDVGQEGLELAYNDWLRGVPGKMRVVKDRIGNIVANLGIVTPPQRGRDLILSIDRRVQYLAYQELKNTVLSHQADSGSVVVLQVKTGEIIAMANVPTFNPNNRAGVGSNSFRNRAVTDLFEPGSTMKTFSIASALDSGKYFPTSIINTNPGIFIINGNKVYDDEHKNNGVINVTQVLQKSSNIGVAKMTLSLPSERLLNLLHSVGFAQTTMSGFPGEASGILPDHLGWRPFMLATLAFGYGISVTALQLTQAYSVIANAGVLRPVTFLKTEQPAAGKQALTAKVAKQMLIMLESVLDIAGTGKRAAIPGYTVAGKTGTAWIAGPGGYYTNRYFSVFAGIAPVSNPELAVVVVVKNPHGQYYGGLVAAPAFARIMEGALRILGVPPDAANQ